MWYPKPATRRSGSVDVSQSDLQCSVGASDSMDFRSRAQEICPRNPFEPRSSFVVRWSRHLLVVADVGVPPDFRRTAPEIRQRMKNDRTPIHGVPSRFRLFIRFTRRRSCPQPPVECLLRYRSSSPRAHHFFCKGARRGRPTFFRNNIQPLDKRLAMPFLLRPISFDSIERLEEGRKSQK